MLFNKYQKLGLKNRAVMAPITRCASSQSGNPSKELIDYYIRRAKNNVGLIIIESSAINEKEALGYVNGAQFHTVLHKNKWAPVIKEIHDKGAKVYIQLFHAGRLSVKEITNNSPVSPSALSPFEGNSFWRIEINGEICHFQTKTKFEIPRELTKAEIVLIIDQFANACKLAEEAGFDGVELHGAHGYLIHQFCSLETNQRTDFFNAKSFNFVRDLVKACRAATSDSFVLCYRVSLHMVDSNYIRYSKENYDIEKLICLLDEDGIDVFHSSELNAFGKAFGLSTSLHSLIRQNTSKPIIACGRISNIHKANEILEKGDADLIGFGRSLINNPDMISLDNKFINLKKFDYKKDFKTVY